MQDEMDLEDAEFGEEEPDEKLPGVADAEEADDTDEEEDGWKDEECGREE